MDRLRAATAMAAAAVLARPVPATVDRLHDAIVAAAAAVATPTRPTLEPSMLSSATVSLPARRQTHGQTYILVTYTLKIIAEIGQ